MGVIYEDAVLIKEAKGGYVITVNCPDKTGLGCDLCRIILLFGLSITKGDVQTDGKWCYIVFWVVGKATTRWSLLKERLMEVCPTYIPAVSEIYYYKPEFQQPRSSDIFLLKFWCSYDRKGLLHDITELLCKLELTIKRVKVSTAPDGKVMDLFFVTDTREELHTGIRQTEVINNLKAVIGEIMLTCEVELASPKVVACSQSILPSSITDDIFNLEASSNSNIVSIDVDNTLSPSHTLLKIFCTDDHKGLVYDIMRTLKDYNIQISYGRFFTNSNGSCEADLFVVQADGKKITDPNKQHTLTYRLRSELGHPLRVNVTNRGPETELLVANPVELSGNGRPLVFHDITVALKNLNIGVFSVEIGKCRVHDREWEVYRIILQESDTIISLTKNEIVKCVRKKLMGWK